MFVVRLFGRTRYVRVPRGGSAPRRAVIAAWTVLGLLVALAPSMLLTTAASARAHAAHHARVPAVSRHLSPDSGLAAHHDPPLPLRAMARHPRPPPPGRHLVRLPLPPPPPPPPHPPHPDLR